MQYGICLLSSISVRLEANDKSEMVTELLYGEFFKVLEQRKHYSRIRTFFDEVEGWISHLQYTPITEEQYQNFGNWQYMGHSSELVSFITTEDHMLLPILLGSDVTNSPAFGHQFEGESMVGQGTRNNLVDMALMYLNTPYRCGGRSPFGMDAAGFTQMVYKICGHRLKRTAAQQAMQGEPLSFIEESQMGDLAFFDDASGTIDHVGIILKDNYIIHCHGTVRIDRLDHTGIFNRDVRNYTHQLRVIKKIVA